MATKVKTSITKQIVFPKQLVELIEIKINKLGVSLPEYVRHLIIKDVEDIAEIPMVDEETEKSIGRAVEDFKNGRFVSFKNSKELEKYFSTLSDGK